MYENLDKIIYRNVDRYETYKEDGMVRVFKTNKAQHCRKLLEMGVFIIMKMVPIS